jgi:hypothetical protein
MTVMTSEIPRLRCAPLGMTKDKKVVVMSPLGMTDIEGARKGRTHRMTVAFDTKGQVR